MHASSLGQMWRFIDKYLANQKGLTVLDVGAQNINGTYRGLFKEHGYLGMDLVDDPNVDLVGWKEVHKHTAICGQFDVVVCGQVAEHCEDKQQLMADIGNALKPGGLLCMIVPSREQVEHRKPDLWRFTQEGACLLVKWAGCEVLEWREEGRDVMAIGRKQ